MTITTASGKTIHLHFVHSSHDFQTRPDAGAQRRELDAIAAGGGRRLTLCDVSQVFSESDGFGERNDEYTLLGQGIAICHKNDVFKKPVGRKVALTYALEAASLVLTKDDRADIWDAYRAQFGDVKH